MLHRFHFVNLFRRLISRSANVSDTFAAGNAGQTLEERLEIQALNVDLREKSGVGWPSKERFVVTCGPPPAAAAFLQQRNRL
jgi:hypothetical protein